MRVLVIGEGEFVEKFVDKAIEAGLDVYVISSEDIKLPPASNFEKIKNYGVIDEDFLENRDIPSFEKVIISIPEGNIAEAISIASVIKKEDIDTLVILPTSRYENIFDALGIRTLVLTVEIIPKVIAEITFSKDVVKNISPFFEDLFIAQISIPPNSKYSNLTIKEAKLRENFGLNIVVAYDKVVVTLDNGSIKVLNSRINITPLTVLKPGMNIVVVGDFEGIKRFITEVNRES